MGTHNLPRGKASPDYSTCNKGVVAQPTAHVLLYLKAAPVVVAAELHSVLGHEVWKGSFEADKYAQSEIGVLEIKAPRGKDQPFK